MTSRLACVTDGDSIGKGGKGGGKVLMSNYKRLCQLRI